MRAPGICRHGKAKQRGAMLMIMISILVVGFAAALVGSLSFSAMKNARHERTSAALAQAKEALIGYAITYGDTHPGEVHGYLPCPDSDGSNGEGSSPLGSCGAQDVSQIGRLPWRTLGLPALRDGDGECLWYAVSGTYKNNTKTGLMNWDTNGKLLAYDSDGTLRTPTDNQAVAVIFGPGAAQSGQNRSGSTAPVCGGNYSAASYLDNDTVHSINNSDVAAEKFVQGISGSDVNDQILFITRQDIWNAVQKRTDFQNTLTLLTRRVAECLADYGKNNPNWNKKSLPWPAPLAFGDYGVNSNYNDNDNSYSGRVPFIVDDSKSDSNNSMSGTTLMANNGLVCPYYSATPSTELQRLYPWWQNWKDHLFYALSREYRPKSSDTNSCSSGGDCVEINGSGDYAAVVMLAGSKLGSQTRANGGTTANSERGVIGNYLEGRNASNHPNSSGKSDYQTQLTPSSTFNDILYCIQTNLNVSTCP